MHMQDVHLATLDLNLLVVLEALLAERHVSRAAARVGLSQSAMSHALARIREVFGDPMLVRTKEGMVPTARALSLEPLLRRALGDLSAAVAGGGPSFDPGTSKRSFTIGSTDYAEILLLPPLMARLCAGAPGVDIMVKLHPDDYVSALGVGAIDLAIAPVSARERDAVAISYEPLLKENFRCVVRRGHPLTRQRLTVARYVAYPHVMVAPQGTRWSFVDEALEALGKRRRVACTVPHFLVAPNLLGQTDLVLTLTERIVKEHMRHLDLVDLPLPLTIPPLTLSMVWHGRNSQEPGHVWLRGILSELAASA
jgi:DNA-binding transcriptional LysR family regulator